MLIVKHLLGNDGLGAMRQICFSIRLDELFVEAETSLAKPGLCQAAQLRICHGKIISTTSPPQGHMTERKI